MSFHPGISTNSRRSTAGFTLIEIMVAMTILVVLVGGVYACFVSVADTADIARTATEQLRVEQYLWKHFSENLGSISPNPSGEYALVGEDDSGAFGPADTLRFTTSLPMSGARALPGIEKTVEYYVDDPSSGEAGGFKTFAIDEDLAAEDTPSVTLFITERPLVLLGEDESGDSFKAGAGAGAGADTDTEEGPWEREVPIRSINFEYYDGASEEWVEDWNSDETGLLPWAIKVQVNLAKSESQLAMDADAGINPQEDFDLEMTVVLPAGAGVLGEFLDPNHYRANEEAAEEAGENKN